MRQSRMTEIEDLYERYAVDVRRFALYLCGDMAMADEITSDTFVRAWMASDRIRQPTVKSYLLAIARNAYVDLLRRATRHRQLDENMPDTRISPQAEVEQSAELRAVLAAGEGCFTIAEGKVTPNNSQSVQVRIEDAKAHCERARHNGATILTELQDHPYGERQYNAQDFYGHRWDFTETIADVAPEEWSGGAFHLE